METLLLAMQAAGMITDYFGTKNQSDLMNKGMKVQQAGIEANIAQSQLEAQEGSLTAMRQLRQTMGTQIATLAARGTSTGAGSAFSLLNESVSNFNSDERIRRLNAMGQGNQLRANKLISSLQNTADTSKLWQGWASRTFNSFGTNSAAWGKMNQGFGLTSA